MAASKKNAKGSKTAHVLNLLTAPGAPKEGAPAGEETDSAAAQAAPASTSRPLLPPILEVAQANDDSLAQQIQQALEEELAEEPAPQPAVEPPVQSITEEVPPVATELPTVEQTPAAPSGGKMSQEDIEKMLAGMAGGEPEPAPAPPAPEPPAAPSGGKMSQADIEKMLAGMTGGEPEPAPAPAAPSVPAASTSAPEEEDDISYINIMQTLVEEKAEKYIKMFGLCTCRHCEADVKALTLTNLVPKYVVLSKLDRIPMLTVYEGRYNSTITAQLTRACKVVMDHPHHGRSE